MRFHFKELPGSTADYERPAVPVTVEGLARAPSSAADTARCTTGSRDGWPGGGIHALEAEEERSRSAASHRSDAERTFSPTAGDVTWEAPVWSASPGRSRSTSWGRGVLPRFDVRIRLPSTESTSSPNGTPRGDVWGVDGLAGGSREEHQGGRVRGRDRGAPRRARRLHAGCPDQYDPALALDTAELFTFIGATQAEAWEDLVQRNGGDPDVAQRRFAERLAKQIDERGTIDVLRHGVDDLGVHIRLAYFRPASGLNPDLRAKYDANRLTVVRQLHYAPDHANALDLVLFVNGLPVATAELKNPLTHQTVEHAMAQYRTDRDPRDALLGRRAIVHFAVDPDLVTMTTRLERSGHAVPALQPRQRPGHDGVRRREPGEPGRLRDGVPVGAGLERDAWLDILQPVRPRRATSRGGSKAASRADAHLPAVPPVGRGPAARGRRARARAAGATTWSSTRPGRGSRTRSRGWRTGWPRCTTRTTRRSSTRSWSSPTGRCSTGSCRTRSTSSSTRTGWCAKIEENSKELADALRAGEARIIVTTLQKFPFVVGQVAVAAASGGTP